MALVWMTRTIITTLVAVVLLATTGKSKSSDTTQPFTTSGILHGGIECSAQSIDQLNDYLIYETHTHTHTQRERERERKIHTASMIPIILLNRGIEASFRGL